MTQWFSVSEAYYIVDKDPIDIAGVPEYGTKYFGEYSGKYPKQAASKAFTGLHKHMKKFYKTGDWFPGYNPENPPIIYFTLVNIDTDVSGNYIGTRIPAHQGNRSIVNSNDGRVRNYRWENKVRKLISQEQD